MPELDDILKEDETAKAEEEAQKKASEAKAEEDKKQMDLEIQKKQEQKENLDKAISEANEELKKLRDAKKGEVEEEIPKIDFNDPASKAWDKHIKESVNPIQSDLDQEKTEIFNFTLKKFLADKPALTADPDKMKELMGTYERIKNNSGRTQEGVLLDLDKSFAAVYSDELLNQARESSVRKAEGLSMFSEPAVSRGSTSYFQEKPDYKLNSLTDEDKQIILRMGYSSIEEWAKDKEKYK